MAQPYPLDRKLPPQVLSQSWWNYNTFNYPVFSWSWLRRYAWLFASLGLFIGVSLVLQIGRGAGDWHLALQAALRTCPAWLCIVMLGPLLGTWVRHHGFPPQQERNFLFVVVVIAIGVSWLARVWYQNYLVEVVRPQLIAKGFPNVVTTFSAAGSARVARDMAFWIALLWCSVEPLQAYFGELRRWKRYEIAREIEQTRQQRDAADLKLAVLQAQVEPHFLYNTMASVRSLVRSDPSRAEATIDALVDHLRATLPKIRDDQKLHTTLASQIDICRSYLEVMRVRMSGRLSYRVEVPQAVADCAFPPLMLISLVENAVKHGVEPKPGPCSICISARPVEIDSESQVEVLIVDDGVGLREGPSDGVGLANIRAQLFARYGERAALTLNGNEHGGTAATIRIPIETAPA